MRSCLPSAVSSSDVAEGSLTLYRRNDEGRACIQGICISPRASSQVQLSNTSLSVRAVFIIVILPARYRSSLESVAYDIRIISMIIRDRVAKEEKWLMSERKGMIRWMQVFEACGRSLAVF